MSLLFEPLALRDITMANRIWLAPMCQYSATHGLVGDWHLMHYGARAAGGFGLLIAEASAVVPEGRITPRCAGLWTDEQAAAWGRVVDLVHECGTRIAVQLAHAGRKGSVYWPWSPVQNSVPIGRPDEADPLAGWQTVAPSALAFPGYAAPRELTADEVAAVPEAFAAAARRADAAGFDAVEIHAAHGYLLHQFLSPLANQRTDAYGGSFENRSRLLLETTDAVRAAWPDGKPLLVRVSATDWLDGGLVVEDLVAVAKELAARGVDLVDTSTGALLPAKIPLAPGYQVPFAARIRAEAGVPTSAVGMITTAEQAEQVLADGAADVVSIGRAGLGDPNWPLHAAASLGEAVGLVSDGKPVAAGVSRPPQYGASV